MTPAASLVACVIPAWAGSKRIADKNLAEVGGRSLLARAVSTALAAFDDVVVSTDSERYAAVARDAGARVPGLRPPVLADDTAAMDPVIADALGWSPAAETVVVVQTTSPFTTAEDLHAVVAALRTHPGAGCALLARALPCALSFVLAETDARSGTANPVAPALYDRRSQDLPALWLPTGGAFAAPAARLRAGGPLQLGPFAVVPVPEERAIDIDEPTDLARGGRSRS